MEVKRTGFLLLVIGLLGPCSCCSLACLGAERRSQRFQHKDIVTQVAHPVDSGAPAVPQMISSRSLVGGSLDAAISSDRYLILAHASRKLRRGIHFQKNGSEIRTMTSAARACRTTVVLLQCCAALLLGACATSKMSSQPTSASPVPIHVIAIAPGGGVLADAVGGELANRGFQIIDPGSTARLVGRVNLTEFDVTRPESILRLRDQGVDAVLAVRAVGAYDQQPQSASARITSTTTGQLISAVAWQNGWGGMAGSIADRTMRGGLLDAASEIAKGVAANIKQDPNAPMQTLSVASAPAPSAPAASSVPTNKFGYAAEKFAKDQRCVAPSAPSMIASGAGFETFSVPCSVGEPLLVRCEFGNCRSLK